MQIEKVIIGNAELYCGDCMEILPTLPSKSFDLAIVDPPYGVLSSVANRMNRIMFENVEPPVEYYDHLLRISSNQVIWGFNYLVNCPVRGGGIVWNKLGSHPTHRKQAPTIGDAEYAYQSFSKNIKMFSYAWMGNVTGNNYEINSAESKERIHPTQKPVALYKWLLANYAQPGQTILDTHMGSGSSVIACLDRGHPVVACEIDKEYFDAACERIERAQQQLKLF